MYQWAAKKQELTKQFAPLTILLRRSDRRAVHLYFKFNWLQFTFIVASTPALSVRPIQDAKAVIPSNLQTLKTYKSEGILSCSSKMGASFYWENWCPRSQKFGQKRSLHPEVRESCRTMCSNHPPISLISVALKLLVSIVLLRLSPLFELQCQEEQAVFHSGRGCTDHIPALRFLLEPSSFSWTSVLPFTLSTR